MSTSSLRLAEPLDGEELRVFNNKLVEYNDSMDVFTLHGLLCALVSGPRVLPLEMWLPYVCDDKEFKSTEEAQLLFDNVMRMQTQIVSDLSSGELFQPLLTLNNMPYDAKMLTKEQKVNLPLWCQGYVLGMYLDQEVWEQNSGDDMAMASIFIMSLADAFEDMPASFGREMGDMLPREDIAVMKDKSIVVLPQIITDIYNFWRENPVLDKPHRREKKIGRNDPCPCGSGKKHKKCCGGPGETRH